MAEVAVDLAVRRCVALPDSRFAFVIAASRENSDSGEEAMPPPVVVFVAVLAVATIFPLHASSPSSSDWVGSKSVCLLGGGFLSSSSTKTSGGYFTDVADIFLTK